MFGAIVSGLSHWYITIIFLYFFAIFSPINILYPKKTNYFTSICLIVFLLNLFIFCFSLTRFSWRSASPTPWPRLSKQPKLCCLEFWPVHVQASASITCVPFSSGPVTDFLLPTCPVLTLTPLAASSSVSWMTLLIASLVKTAQITSCPSATCWSTWQTARHCLSPGNSPTCAQIPASTSGLLWTKPSRRAS